MDPNLQQPERFTRLEMLRSSTLENDQTTTSPVTDLARNLGGLFTSSRDTPRRRISWSSGNEDTPDNAGPLRKVGLFQTGNVPSSHLFLGQEDSPTFHDRLLRDVSVADNCLNTSGGRMVRRVRTAPVSEMCGKENIPRSEDNQRTVSGATTKLPLAKNLCPRKPSSLLPASLTLSSTSERLGRTLLSSHCDSDSQDSGCSLLQDPDENAFAVPSLPRRTVSPLKCIANNQSLIRLNSTNSSLGYSSSERSSVSASGTDCEDFDDGFHDIFDMDAMDSDDAFPIRDTALPKDFHRLLRNPISSDNSENEDVSNGVTYPVVCHAGSPVRLPIRRCLSMIEESPVSRRYTSPREKLLQCVDRNNNLGTDVRRPEDTRKRLLHDEDDCTFKKPCDPPLALEQKSQELSSRYCPETKRRRSVTYLTKSPSDSLVMPSPRLMLQRSHSETDAIARALQKSTYNPNLIGDCSGTYALPLVKGRHDDLKAITCTTLSQLISGKYKDTVDNYTIVDCRYPYEYEGGHIKDACNLYTKESIVEKLISHQPPATTSRGQRNILVFHCEFSSERGPNLCRFLRNKDREANKDNYPNLYHPEIYLLEGGYREFFHKHKELCTPQDYLPMLSKDHEKEFRKFRSKSKSWSTDNKSRIAVRPGLKL